MAAMTDRDAERFLLAAMLESGDACAEAAVLSPDAWTVAAYGIVAQEIMRRFAAGEPADVVAVAQGLDDAGQLKAVGKLTGLTAVLADVVTTEPGYVRSLVERVRSKWAQRQLLHLAQEVGRFAADLNNEFAGRSVAEVLGDVGALLEGLQGKIDQSQGLYTARDMATELYAEMGRQREDAQTPGVMTGLADLDAALKGVRPGQLVFVASRPGMGKSLFAEWWTVQAALAGRRVYYGSLEMTLVELAARIASQLTLTPYADMLSDQPLSAEGWHRLTEHLQWFGRLPIVASEGPCTVSEIRANIRRARRQLGGVDMVVIDQLEMVEPDGEAASPDERERVVMGRTIDRIKQLAIRERVGIVLLHQLSRAVDARPNHMPQLSDLAETSRAERRADKVVFLMRPAFYDNLAEDADEHDLTVSVAKHRMGETGIVRLHVDLETNRIYSLDWKHTDAEAVLQ